MQLYLYNIVSKTIALGMGERFAIWTQGCEKNCKGCIATDTHSKESGGFFIDIKELANQILNTKNIQGVTISGGEPFLQTKKIIKLIKLLKEKNSSLDFIVYSGYKYEELKQDNVNIQLLNLIDLLIDGDYQENLDNNEPLKGSSNQNVYAFTKQGEVLRYYMQNVSAREVDLFIQNNDLFIAGIPPKNLIKKLKESK